MTAVRGAALPISGVLPIRGALQIDWTRCDGHGLCAALLPEAVTLDEWGYPVIDQTRLPGGRAIRRAVGACPALALGLQK
ncbi:MAG: ferredoxin [Pseudonocardiales bacterium]|nr:ferredoxin [Pseudonocardiales bacterium]